ncbi:MAG: BamA/TamA family outer membrane protein [Campylobacterota bacterium]|nr:BamA/TamA family outer membrane protein [Campylobacterota bacterium]
MKAITIFICTLLALSLSAAQFITQDVNATKKQSSWIALPYIFSSESMGVTVGAVGIFSGLFQPQMTIVATAFVGSEQEVKKVSDDNIITQEEERAKGLVLGVNGYRPWFSNRLFISALGAYSYYPKKRLYIDGSHDSKKDLESEDVFEMTPLQTQGFNNWVNVNFRYVLPWGESRDSVLPLMTLRRGIVTNRDNRGGGTPFVSGQTIVDTELFYTYWSVDKLTPEPSYNSNGIRLKLDHDNTDYPANPARGYRFNMMFSLDAGLGDSTQSWNALEAEYAHFIPLENFSWTRHHVIALNTWSAYSPSWDKSKKMDDTQLDAHRPPMWEGARLGGWSRMRAYDSNRFNDKAALYFATEYRIIPQINPMRDQEWSPIPIDWFQVVLFAEAGRVAESYDLTTLMSDMHYDAGFSVRALAAKVPLRFEMAFGEEGSSMWVMIQ